MKILGIDPGLNATGWAVLEDGELKACGTYRTPQAFSQEAKMKWLCWQFKDCLHFFTVDAVVVERMQIHITNNKDPNDLIPLAQISGMALGLLGLNAVWFNPLPMEWKGQVPKDIHHARLKKQFPGVKASKDAWDAIGLALWGQEKMNAQR